MSYAPSPEELHRLQGMLDGTIELPPSIWHYARKRQLALAESLSGRVPIYLDSRFWIDLRRSEEGDKVALRAQPLLTALRHAVAKGRAFCPISASTFVEMLKHSSKEVRVRTARMVDELSLGVCLVSMEELFDAEIGWLIDRPGDHAVDPLQVPIWTRLSYALGTIAPQSDVFAPQVMLALQVATFDTIWATPLEEVAETLVDPMRSNLAGSAEKITRDSRAHAHEATDFATVYRSEAVGGANHCLPMFAAHIQRKEREQGITPVTPTDDQLEQYRNVLANLLVLGKARQALRSSHIRASLHAIIRMNKDRRFKPNDLFDIEHAVAGVGYCKALFTESSLRTAITQKPLELDQLYGCVVTNDMAKAIQFVSEL